MFPLITSGVLASCQEPVAAPIGPPFPQETAGLAPAQASRGKVHVSFGVDAAVHVTCSATSRDSWLSRTPGSTSSTTLAVKWEADAVVVTPTDADYALADDAGAYVVSTAGAIQSVGLNIQDVAGPEGIYYPTDEDPLVVPAEASPDGFTRHLHAPNVPIWRHKGHTGGPRVEMVGTICVDDLVFTPKP